MSVPAEVVAEVAVQEAVPVREVVPVQEVVVVQEVAPVQEVVLVQEVVPLVLQWEVPRSDYLAWRMGKPRANDSERRSERCLGPEKKYNSAQKMDS
jgi:hypothetical protein